MRSAAEHKADLRSLTEALGKIGSGEAGSRPPVDAGGGLRLARGIVHEWFGPLAVDQGQRPLWSPPLYLLAHAASLALSQSSHGRVLWIGRRCWPHPRTLIQAGGRTLLDRSVFVAPPDAAARVWAVDVSLRCAAAAVVVADGSGMNMAATRRLQLAAAHGGSLALIARPPHERAELSAAGARWGVRPLPSESGRPRWIVELLRCKGVQPTHGEPRSWIAEWDHAQSAVLVSAVPALRSAETPGAAGPRLRSA